MFSVAARKEYNHANSRNNATGYALGLHAAARLTHRYWGRRAMKSKALTARSGAAWMHAGLHVELNDFGSTVRRIRQV